MGRIGIIGGGHAAIDLVRKLRAGGFTDSLDILEKSNFFPYERPPLSKKGLTRELSTQDFSLASQHNLEELNVNFRRRSQVTLLSRHKDSYEVTLMAGGSHFYDQIVLASGVRPRILDLQTNVLTPICYLQSLEDMLAIQAHLIRQIKILIIGAGFIGLETASSLRSLGHEVTVLERNPQIMNRVLSGRTASFFQNAHQAMGTQFFIGSDVQHVENERSGRSTFVLSSGDRITPDLVLVAIGVEPVTDFVDFPIEKIGSHILVDSEGRTSSPNFFAIGDLAARPNPVEQKSMVKIQSIDSANLSSSRLASLILGETVAPYKNWVPKFWSDQASHKLQIAGLRPESAISVVRETDDLSQFVIGFFREGRLMAIEAVNSPIEFMQARKIIQSACQVSLQEFSDATISLATLERV